MSGINFNYFCDDYSPTFHEPFNTADNEDDDEKIKPLGRHKNSKKNNPYDPQGARKTEQNEASLGRKKQTQQKESKEPISRFINEGNPNVGNAKLKR